MSDLSGKKIAFLANRGVEQPELTDPWKAIEEAGGEPVLVSAESGTITALKGDWDRGDTFDVDVALADAQAANYDALVLPGGTLNADSLRIDEDARTFVRGFIDAGKPVAPICHGGWILVDLDAVNGRTLTSVDNIRADLENAGADWVDKAFVSDGNFHSSRTPDDLPAFTKGIVKAFAEA